MPGPLPQAGCELALDGACRDVEATIARVAKLVLHASALADRMDRVTDPDTTPQRQQRVRVLRDAAEAGRRTMCQVVSAAPATTPATALG